MSRHFFETEVQGKRANVQVGYDRPLGHMYLNVTDMDASPPLLRASSQSESALGGPEDEDEIYISMYDRNLLKPERGFRLYGGMTMQELKDKLTELAIQLPEGLQAALEEDLQVQRGNLDRQW